MKLKCRCGHEIEGRGQEAVGIIQCEKCGLRYRAHRGADGKLKFSLASSGPSAVRPTKVAVPSAQRRSWWHYLADAWSYPFRGSAKWALLVWLLLRVFVAPFLAFFPILGLLVPFAILGLLAMYEFEIIRQSAYDAEAKPSFPLWEDWYESVLRPLGQVLASAGVSCFPYLAASLAALVWYMPPWWPAVQLAGLALLFFLLPVNVLAVAAADDAGAINPRFTFPALVRVPIPYVLCVLFCYAGLWLGMRFPAALRELTGAGVLATFAGAGVWVYLVTVAARALGTLHYAYEDRFRWMR
jgi:hypothetical protein